MGHKSKAQAVVPRELNVSSTELAEDFRTSRTVRWDKKRKSYMETVLSAGAYVLPAREGDLINIPEELGEIHAQFKANLAKPLTQMTAAALMALMAYSPFPLALMGFETAPIVLALTTLFIGAPFVVSSKLRGIVNARFNRGKNVATKNLLSNNNAILVTQKLVDEYHNLLAGRDDSNLNSYEVMRRIILANNAEDLQNVKDMRAMGFEVGLGDEVFTKLKGKKMISRDENSELNLFARRMRDEIEELIENAN